MSGQFWFPFMKYDEIIEAFQEWGMNVSEHSLRNPTPEFVTNVYAACLQQVTSLNEHSYQPAVHKKGAAFQAYSLPISLSLSFSLLPCSKQGHSALALFPYTTIVSLVLLFYTSRHVLRVARTVAFHLFLD